MNSIICRADARANAATQARLKELEWQRQNQVIFDDMRPTTHATFRVSALIGEFILMDGPLITKKVELENQCGFGFLAHKCIALDLCLCDLLYLAKEILS